MPRALTSPDRLFDRTWRPGHPFRPKLSRARRAVMGLALFVLCIVIGGYWYITDSDRVRAVAQGYLSRLIGGNVTIGAATLSIFQGLQLTDVRVYADNVTDGDSLLFSAQSFQLRVNGAALLEGRLEADQIVAIDPYVRLTENLDTGKWTHERLRRPKSMPRTEGDRPLQLPQVVLRNAIVEYGQTQNGQRRTRGTMALEGQLSPAMQPDVYLFKLQSRGGASQGMGPSVDGKFEMSTGALSASLMNFRLGADLEAMLPAQVRHWWKDHDIAGRVDVPELTYQPTTDGSLRFRAEIYFRGVQLVVHPEEWLSAEEMLRSQWMRSALNAMRGAGLDHGGFVDEFQALVEATPIAMQQVTGKFVFTESAIDVQNVSGFVESNGVKINGRIVDYTNPSMATANIKVSSLETDDIIIPASPRYINSMPQPVREIYDHLRPQGHCRFWVLVKRTEPGGRPEVEGEVNILDGSFVFDKFPYPIEGATGKLVFRTNPKNGQEILDIVDIRGHGLAGSANEKARVHIAGWVSPFGAESEVKITVTGNDIVSEPLLFSSFPRATQRALTMFDAPGKGQFPVFRGGFTCQVHRPFGIDTPWDVVTNIRLDEAAGQLVAFPYPMSGVTGELSVTETSVKIAHATMKKNGATLQIDGEVSWGAQGKPHAPVDGMQSPGKPGEAEEVPPLRPELRIVATNVPIDADLLGAMPGDQAEWLTKMGLSGRFDLDGNVTRGGSDVDFDFRIKLREGSMWPTQGTFAASNLNGSMRLTPGRVVFESLAGKRGDSDLAARGSVSWAGPAPEIAISADAKNLLLDAALYGTLPEAARSAWDQVQPKGTLDMSLTYSGKVEKHPTTLPTTAPATSQPSVSYELTLTPRKLSVTPTAVPYRLDDLTGTITVSPHRVVLQNVTAQHGDATVNLSGTGTSSSPDPDAPIAWDFKIAGDHVPVDDELHRALPKAMSDLIKSLKLRGKIAFDFEKLLVARSPAPSTTQPAQPKDKSDDPPLDVDFTMRLRATDASLDVGVPLAEIKNGTAIFKGATRASKLAQLDGAIDFPVLTLAGRNAANLRATITKPADRDLLRVPKLEVEIADGELAGQFDCTLADAGPTRYAVTLVLRNADVKQLTGDAAPDLRGRLSASLALEGAFNDTASRRGRGDVSVTGDRLYRIPVLLGLLQITNLALPITSPFNEATSRYVIDGQRVTLESIELRAKDMLMQGNGYLDFTTKQVRLSFVTESANWPKLPIIGDLLQGARHELLQIHVKGTLEEPKISAGAFGTVTTTVDEVLRGNEQDNTYGKRK